MATARASSAPARTSSGYPHGGARGLIARLAAHPVVQALALVFVIGAAYWPSFHAGVLWDDDQMLLRETHVRGLEGLASIWAGRGGADFIPVTHTLFWLEWRLLGGTMGGAQAVHACHGVSIALHVLGALLAWRVLARLRAPWAWLAAALFALHPMNVASVAWISETKNTLSLVFYAASLLCYLEATEGPVGEGRRWRPGYVASLALFVMGLLSKPSGVGMPLVMLAAAWWRKRRLEARDGWDVLPFVVPAVVLAAVTVWFQQSRAIAGVTVQPEGFWLRLVAAGPAVWFYVGKVLLPMDLMMVHPTAPPAVTAAALIADVGLVAWIAATYRARGSWAGGAWAAGVAALALVAPVLGLVDMYFLRYSRVAEHFGYLASIPLVALAVGGLAWGVRRLAPAGGSGVALAVGGLLVAACGGLTVHREAAFADREAMWRDNLLRNPGAWVAHRDLGGILAETGRATEALQHYAEAERLQPRDSELQYNWGRALTLLGRRSEAVARYRSAIDIDASSFRAHANLGTLLEAEGHREEARAEYLKALSILPDYPDARSNLGNLLASEGRLKEAEMQYREAIRVAPRHAEAHYNLGICLERQGRVDEALEELSRAGLLDPTHQRALFHLGRMLTRKGRLDQARIPLDRLLDLNPRHVLGWSALGELLGFQKRWVEAERALIKALQLDPRCTEALIQLGEIYRVQHRKAPEAMALFKAAQEASPDSVLALNNRAWLVATFPDDPWRKGQPGGVEEGIRFAEEAARRTGRTDANILDTLAATYARAGRWDDAVRTAGEALERARAAGDETLARSIETHATAYGRHVPWEDPPPATR